LTPSQPRLLDLLRDDQLPSIPPLAEDISVYRNHPVRIQYCQLLRNSTLQMSSLYTQVCGQASVLCVKVCSVVTTVTSEHETILVLSA
jgi:hypothetical protein